MVHYFFDTSATVKYYHVESGTPAVMEIFAKRERRIRISSLGFLEMQSAFAMKVRSGVLDVRAADMQRARFLLDIAAGDIEVSVLTDNHYLAAERLIGKYGYSQRLRTLDSLQLAVALGLAQVGLLDLFVVADQALGEVAGAEGLHVLNPIS